MISFTHVSDDRFSTTSLLLYLFFQEKILICFSYIYTFQPVVKGLFVCVIFFFNKASFENLLLSPNSD